MGDKTNNTGKQSDDAMTFVCEWCGKAKRFTRKEIEKKKKIDPNLKKEGFEYYIPCPLCKGGYMMTQEDIVFHQLAADVFSQE